MAFEPYVRMDRRHAPQLREPHVRMHKAKMVILPRFTLAECGIDPDDGKFRCDLYFDSDSGELAIVLSETGSLGISRVGYMGRSEGNVSIRGLMNKYGFTRKCIGVKKAEIRTWGTGQKAIVFNPGFQRA